MNVHTNKGNNRRRKASLEVHLGFSKKEIGDVRIVRTLTLNGELFVISVSTPRKRIRILIIQEVVPITVSLEEVVTDMFKIFQLHIKEDILVTIGVKVVIIMEVQAIVMQVQ